MQCHVDSCPDGILGSHTFCKSNLEISSYFLGGFSRKLIAIIALMDRCILSTITFAWGFLTVVETDLIDSSVKLRKRLALKTHCPCHGDISLGKDDDLANCLQMSK